MGGGSLTRGFLICGTLRRSALLGDGALFGRPLLGKASLLGGTFLL